jgi:hypothetical protein
MLRIVDQPCEPRGFAASFRGRKRFTKIEIDGLKTGRAGIGNICGQQLLTIGTQI